VKVTAVDSTPMKWLEKMICGYAPQPTPPQSRNPFSRMHNLLALLKTGEAFTAPKLAALIKVSPKTIHRDIEYLRQQGVKIVFCHFKWSFRLETQNAIPPQFSV